VGLARRQYRICVSNAVFEEYEAVVAELQERYPRCNSAGALGWLRLKARWVESASLGKPRSRDPKDDAFIGCALAARAKYVITQDDDLLVLGKPFGIEMIAPSGFLIWLREHRRGGI
jgi:putative PIN family toxin of toxin-antitoxin system